MTYIQSLFLALFILLGLATIAKIAEFDVAYRGEMKK